MKSGFSLFELLVALAIMGLLASFVIPNVRKVQEKSQIMASDVNARIYQSALENYSLEHAAYPVGSLGMTELYTALQAAEMLKTNPSNPFTRKAYSSLDTKGKILYASNAGEDYTLTLYGPDGTTTQLVLNNL